MSDLIKRANWYELLALMFQHPTDETVSRIRSLASDIADDDDSLSVLARRFRDEVVGLDRGSLIRIYTRLFMTAGACRANETDYERLSFSMTQQLADVTGFYKAFGVEVDSTSGERPDYVGTELEFMRLLLLKQAYAEENDWSEPAEITQKAVRDFIQSHLLTWIPAFCSTLLKATNGDGPYATVATLLEAFIATEGDRVTKKSVQ